MGVNHDTSTLPAAPRSCYPTPLFAVGLAQGKHPAPHGLLRPYLCVLSGQVRSLRLLRLGEDAFDFLPEAQARLFDANGSPPRRKSAHGVLELTLVILLIDEALLILVVNVVKVVRPPAQSHLCADLILGVIARCN